jgi:hypothetical protein
MSNERSPKLNDGTLFQYSIIPELSLSEVEL